MSDDVILRVCMRLDDAIVHVQGSVIRHCKECLWSVWYDPRQLAPLGEQVICNQCFKAGVKKGTIQWPIARLM